MEFAETKITLDRLPTGTRLIIRSQKDWRHAAVSKIGDEKVVLTVCSPTGRTYRLRRELECEVVLNGMVPVLAHEEISEDWRDNLSPYDLRW